MEFAHDVSHLDAVERDRQEALQAARNGGWNYLRESYPDHLGDPDIVTAAFQRFYEPLGAFRESELQVPLAVRDQVRRNLTADRDAAWKVAFAKRVETWRADLEKNLGVLVTPLDAIPADLSVPKHPQIDSSRPGILEARVEDGRRILFQVLPSGHYFAAEVYSPEGAYLGGNHDYFWEEFHSAYLS